MPVNIVRRVAGHEKASTTLDRYTHTPEDYADRVRLTFADDPLTFRPSPHPVDPEDGPSPGLEGEPKRDDPRRGEDGGRRGPAPGGSSRTTQRSRGGATAEGLSVVREDETPVVSTVCLSEPGYVEWCSLHSLLNSSRRV
ncbi:hypothetical protein [Salinispora cortesiana]|uniref:hypothetical protein n=1 Tax=Salinispora cortesiana TaxID=1305843 RepID=UPI001FE0E152|nr:hypothetical protein [Salinispora cortesiana]